MGAFPSRFSRDQDWSMRSDLESLARNMDSQVREVTAMISQLHRVGCRQLRAPDPHEGHICPTPRHQVDCAFMATMDDGLRGLRTLQGENRAFMVAEAEKFFQRMALGARGPRENSNLGVGGSGQPAPSEGGNDQQLQLLIAQLESTREVFIHSETRVRELEQERDTAIWMVLETRRQCEIRLAAAEGECQRLCSVIQSLRLDLIFFAKRETRGGELRTDLERQIGQLVASATSSTYMDMDMDIQLRLLADDIKDALAGLTRALEPGYRARHDKKMPAEGSTANPRDPSGSRSRLGLLAKEWTAKFYHQSVVSETVFSGFEAEDFQIDSCGSSELDWDKWRAQSYQQYKELSSVGEGESELLIQQLAELVHMVVRGGEEARLVVIAAGCPPTCSQYGGARDRWGPTCVCGRVRFLRFCHRKLEQLSECKTAPTTFWEGLELCGDHGFCKHLLPLLTNVWLSHLLVCSFEQPSALLKVRKNMVFDRTYMVAVAASESDDDRGMSSNRVAYMVVPGFWIGSSAIRSQVYLVH